MRSCINCLYTAKHPFGVIFKDGLCSGCVSHQEKHSIDWSLRAADLAAVMDKRSTRCSAGWDCLVPIDGSPNSFFVVHTLVNKFGFNPLLYSFSNGFDNALGHYNNRVIQDHFGLSLVHRVVEKEKLYECTKEALGVYGYLYWVTQFLKYVEPFNIAQQESIPAIIFHDNQAVEQVGSLGRQWNPEATYKVILDYGLAGISPNDILGSCCGDGLSRNFQFPKANVLSQIHSLFLSDYIYWDVGLQSRFALDNSGVKGRRHSRTFDTVSSLGCLAARSIADGSKYRQLGYSKVTDHLSREIRFRRLERAYAVELEKYYAVQVAFEESKCLELLRLSKNNLLKIDTFFGRKKFSDLIDFSPQTSPHNVEPIDLPLQLKSLYHLTGCQDGTDLFYDHVGGFAVG